MPNWKKVIVSGSSAVLASVSGSSFVYSGGDVVAQNNLKSVYSSGDEGGEIFLNKSVTNTTLNTGVTIDVYQNRLRIFEAGGTNRGGYYDISTLGTGASTNLASGGGTVTSVSASGTVSGITLGGGPITGAGTLTLSGTISGLTNSNLSGTAGITNANLANSSVTIGSTAISLGGTSTTLAGLTNVTSTNFTGSLLGTATTASYVTPLIQSVVITGSLKVKNGSTPVLDTVAGNLYDVYGGASVNFSSNQLLNYYGANVVNWGSNYLLSNNNTSASTMSIDWENRYLADTAGTQRLKWTTSGVQVTGSLRVTAGVTASLLGTASYATIASQLTPGGTVGYVPVWSSNTQLGNSVIYEKLGSIGINTGVVSAHPGILTINGSGTTALVVTGSTILSGSLNSYGAFAVYDPTGILSADLGAARLLRDATGAPSIDYSNRIHYDASGTKSAINSRFRYLVATGGTTTVNWDDTTNGLRLFDKYTTSSVDWGNRQLEDDGVLFSGTPIVSINWNNRTAHDTNSSGSIEWASRRLTDQTEVPSIRWQNRALCDTAGTGVLEWDMATYQKSLHSIAFSRTEIDLGGSIIDEFSNMNGYPFYPEGRVIKGATIDGAVTDFDFVFLDTDGTWKAVDNASTRATKMLGVAWNIGGDNRVLLEGHLPVNSVNASDSPYVVGVDHGLPIYLSASFAATTTVPTATGEYVRIIGHAYYQNGSSTDYWMINFNPDHTWVQL